MPVMIASYLGVERKYRNVSVVRRIRLCIVGYVICTVEQNL